MIFGRTKTYSLYIPIVYLLQDGCTSKAHPSSAKFIKAFVVEESNGAQSSPGIQKGYTVPSRWNLNKAHEALLLGCSGSCTGRRLVAEV